MIGKIIGAYAGDKLAKKTSAIGGPGGAALGVVAATVLSRISLPAMLALGAGGYIAKKVFDKKSTDETDIGKDAPTTASKPSTVAA